MEFSARHSRARQEKDGTPVSSSKSVIDDSEEFTNVDIQTPRVIANLATTIAHDRKRNPRRKRKPIPWNILAFKRKFNLQITRKIQMTSYTSFCIYDARSRSAYDFKVFSTNLVFVQDRTLANPRAEACVEWCSELRCRYRARRGRDIKCNREFLRRRGLEIKLLRASWERRRTLFFCNDRSRFNIVAPKREIDYGDSELLKWRKSIPREKNENRTGENRVKSRRLTRASGILTIVMTTWKATITNDHPTPSTNKVAIEENFGGKFREKKRFCENQLLNWYHESNRWPKHFFYREKAVHSSESF